MDRNKKFDGIDKDLRNGFTQTGNIVRDAWVFGILPETETCEGWLIGRVLELYDQVYEAWAPYGHLASNLPPELRDKHRRIYDEAIQRAREYGWQPDMEGGD